MKGETDGRGKINADVLYATILEGTDGVQAEYQVMTIQDIADELDVSDQAIRNHIDEVEGIEDVQTRRIDRSTVYWTSDPSPYDYELNTLGDDLGLSPFEVLVHYQQTDWRYAKKQALRGALSDSRPKTREILYNHLCDYIGRANLREMTNTVEGDEGVEFEPNPDGWMAKKLDEDELQYYATEAFLFDTEWFGEVRGIGGFLRFDMDVGYRRKDIMSDDGYTPGDEYQEGGEDLFDEDQISDQDRDEIYPSLTELVGAGEKIDQLVVEIYGIDA